MHHAHLTELAKAVLALSRGDDVHAWRRALEEFTDAVSPHLVLALLEENARLAAVKKSDDLAYEHVVEMYHAAAEENARLAAFVERVARCHWTCPKAHDYVGFDWADTPVEARPCYCPFDAARVVLEQQESEQ